MLVSVIIPVYNCATTIERCLDSIFSQEYDDYEVIAVNDCSTDDSLQVIQRFVDQLPQAKAAKFRLLNNEKNQGSGTTRRIGMQAAQGQYMIQVDSDDYVHPQYLSKLTQAVKGGDDMAICNLEFFNNDSSWQNEEKIVCDNQYLLCKVLSGEIHSSLCNKLMKSSIIREHDIYPYRDMGIYDDMSVTYRVLFFCHQIAYVSEALYFVDRTSTQSATFSYREKVVPSLVNLRHEMKQFASQFQWNEKLCRALDTFLVELSCYMIRSIKPENLKPFSSDYLPGLKSFVDIWRHPHVGMYGKMLATLAKARLFILVKWMNGFIKIASR